MRWSRLLVLMLCLCISPTVSAVKQFSYKVLEKKPQDRNHHVQGLEIHDGLLYVSTGMYGQSRLLRYNLDSGERQVELRLNQRLWGEGLTVLGDRVYQLTYRAGMLLEFSRDEMKFLARHSIPGQGWGLTNDGEHLIFTDGGNKLHYMDPVTKRIIRSVSVTENGNPLAKLNELEWIAGKIWANVFMTDRIVIIDPESGEVSANIDLSGLFPHDQRTAQDEVLNGIARDHRNGDIWVTGKRWPWLFSIDLVPVETTPEDED